MWYQANGRSKTSAKSLQAAQTPRSLLRAAYIQVSWKADKDPRTISRSWCLGPCSKPLYQTEVSPTTALQKAKIAAMVQDHVVGIGAPLPARSSSPTAAPRTVDKRNAHGTSIIRMTQRHQNAFSASMRNISFEVRAPACVNPISVRFGVNAEPT